MNNAKNKQAYDHSSYKRIRKQLLEDNPYCFICGNHANTIDHIRPVDTFPNPIDANTLENCRVLCRSCNGRAGARYGNAKTSGTLPNIEEELKPKPKTKYKKINPNAESDTEFLDATSLPHPDSSNSVSDPYGIRGSGTSSDFPRTGLEIPRLSTNTQSGDRSYLLMLEELAEIFLKVKLMPWQRRVLGDQLSLNADGRLMFKQSCVSVARQNGKSVALKCLVLFWLVKMPILRGEPQTVLTTAHRLDLASELFNSLAGILEQEFDAKVIYSYGRQSVTMKDGTRWLVRAATPSAGHGLSVDLLVVDELFGCSPESVDEGMVPTQRARRDPLMSCWSTAGTEESVVFKRMRERGIGEIDTGKVSKLYYAEYSPPSNLDPMSREAWPYANPALGITLDMETIEEESKAPNTASFMRSAVNIWVTSHRSWLDQGWFATLNDAGELPTEGGWLAVESSTDDHRFVGVRAVEDGNKVKVTVEFIVDNLNELWEAVDNSRKEHKGMQVACGATLDVHLSPAIKGSAILVGQRELQKWTTVVRSMTMAGQVRHTGEELLIEQCSRATLVKHQGHLSLSSIRSPGPIELCRAYVWAVAMAGRPKAENKVAYAFSS